MEKEVLVLGAGVAGLSTGIRLLQEGFKVTLWAKEFSPNTTSDVAAAVWYPYKAEPKEKVLQWSKLTDEFLREHFLDDEKAGVRERRVIQVFKKETSNPWWKDAVKDFRRVTKKELPKNYIDGFFFKVLAMDTSIYMPYLLEWFKNLGGVIIKREVKGLDEIPQNYDFLVNCSSFGSIRLFNDKELFPVRGQIVKVRKNGFEYAMFDDEDHNNLAYIIPRENDIILGGTAQEYNNDTRVNPEDTKAILERCAKLNSRFERVEILGESAGLRPARSMIRLEKEKVSDLTVIHNYGHGGAGFTISWGCAEEVIKLVKEAIKK